MIPLPATPKMPPVTTIRHGLTRRAALTAAGTVGLLLAVTGTAAAGHVPAVETVRDGDARSPEGQVNLTLPPPTGAHAIGTTSLHLVDHARQDPWTSSTRELMISVWYPSRSGEGHRRAPWLPPAASRLYKQQVGEQLRTSLDEVALPATHAGWNAPVAAGRRHPVVLFSPGYNSIRALNTALVEDLASRGYVVVTIDHTHEAPIVEFPHGRLELGRAPRDPEEDIARIMRVRRDDTRFVLDEITALNTGGNPDAGHRRLPRGLGGSLDLSRIGMFGHSLGGATAAEVMARDPRVLAGADLDGSIPGPVASTGLDRPFLLMSNATHGRDNDPTWEEFWGHLRGWRRELRLRDSGHQTYTDDAPLARQLIEALPLSPPVVAQLTERIGTIDAGRAVAAERAYLGSFFDLHLRHRDDHLLSGPSPRYPEITFVP